MTSRRLHDTRRAADQSAALRVTAGVHAIALATLVARPHSWPFLAAASAVNHLVLFGASVSPRSRLLGPNLNRLPAPCIERGEVALTFDDGPDPRVTPEVLALLETRGARASFFCIGRRAERHPALIADIVRRGHHVENHSYGHPPHFAFHGPRGMGREIDAAQVVLTRLCGRPPRYFRAPAGMRNPWLGGVLARRSLQLASWTRRGLDTVSSDAGRIARRLTRKLAAGDVLLLHDRGAGSDRNPHSLVCEVLERLLEELSGRRLQPVPLPRRPENGR